MACFLIISLTSRITISSEACGQGILDPTDSHGEEFELSKPHYWTG